MVKCIYCGANTKVNDKRTAPENSTRRRRQCLKCGKRFTTKEVALEDNMVTVKKVVIKKQKAKPVKVIKEKKVKEVVAELSPEKANLIALFKKGVTNGRTK